MENQTSASYVTTTGDNETAQNQPVASCDDRQAVASSFEHRGAGVVSVTDMSFVPIRHQSRSAGQRDTPSGYVRWIDSFGSGVTLRTLRPLLWLQCHLQHITGIGVFESIIDHLEGIHPALGRAGHRAAVITLARRTGWV